MPAPRFLVQALPSSGLVVLSEVESRHASNVLRLTVGQPVQLFDGCGGEAEGLIQQCTKRSVLVQITRRTDANRELLRPLEILVALPKGDRQKGLVDALVQLGVSQLTPLATQRGVAQPAPSALQRLQRTVVESSKQCGRNLLLHVAQPMSVAELARVPWDGETISLFAHPYGKSLALADAGPPTQPVTAARIAIGPEGGFTDDECEQLRVAGWLQVSLGPRILRIEVAAMLVAAWWSTRQEVAAKSNPGASS